jgi:hypothetical protein
VTVTRFVPVLAAVVLLASGDARTQPATIHEIAARFYPPSLTELAQLAGGPIVRHQCQAVLETDPGGAPRTIVAAYTNASTSAIRVLRSTPGGDFSVVAEAGGDRFAGVTCGIRLVDLDNDGRDEVFVDFNVMANSVSWVFRWDAGRLIDLTPLSPGPDGSLDTDLYRARPVDVDGDGIKEIYVVSEYPPPGDGPAEPNLLFRMAGGTYVRSEPVVGVWTSRPAAGSPATSRVRVRLPKGARGPFTMHVVNGEAGRSSRVTGLQLWINDRQVLGPSDLDARVAVVDRPVSLSDDNLVSIRVEGPSGSQVVMILRSRDWDR